MTTCVGYLSTSTNQSSVLATTMLVCVRYFLLNRNLIPEYFLTKRSVLSPAQDLNVAGLVLVGG